MFFFANSNLNGFINYFPSLSKTATDCCRMQRQIQRDACGSVHTGRVAQQCLHANCLQNDSEETMAI